MGLDRPTNPLLRQFASPLRPQAGETQNPTAQDLLRFLSSTTNRLRPGVESSLGSRSGMSPDRMARLVGSRAEYEPASLGGGTDPIEDRYGNDMSWLDPTFQQQAATLGRAHGAGVYADPRAVSAQQDAVDQLLGIARGGGATALERARMAGARGMENQWVRGQRDAEMNDLAERGMAGSGAELLAQIGDRQAAANRLNQSDLDTEAQLEQRAIQSMMQAGGMAGQQRSQSFAEGAARAGAQDDFDRLNNATINAVGQANKNYLRNAQDQMMQRRYDSWQRGLDRNTNIAQSLMGFDQNENQTGWGQGNQLAQNDANTFNNAQQGFNQLVTNPSYNGSTAALGGRNAQIQYGQQGMGDFANAFTDFGNTLLSGGKSGAMGNILGDDDKEKK